MSYNSLDKFYNEPPALKKFYDSLNKFDEVTKSIIESNSRLEQIAKRFTDPFESYSKSFFEFESKLKSLSNPFLETQSSIEKLGNQFNKTSIMLNVLDNYNLITDKLDYFKSNDAIFLNSSSLLNIVDSLSIEIENDDPLIENYDSQNDDCSITTYKENILTLKELLPSRETRMELLQWINTIAAIIALIISISGFIKPNHEEQYLKILQEINSNLEHVVQLESGK